MTLTPAAAARVTETPNAVMTTLASPTQGGATASLWRVEMAAGQTGPLHRFDVEQTWHLLDGAAAVRVGELDHDLAAGDTLVIEAGVPRRIGTTNGAAFVVAGSADGRATPITDAGPGEPVAPAWIA